MEFEDSSRLTTDFVLCISRKEERCHRAIDSGCWFDDERRVALVGRLVEEVEALPRMFGMLVEVVVRSLGDAL